jgi:tetratricopeptide (TPR) repeat protein
VYEHLSPVVDFFRLRFSCERTIFLDFEFAQEEGVERHLWDAHIKINGRYRKVVDHYRQGDKKKNVVERRKVEQRYVDFIKRSQFFYKGYIQRLASHFSGLKELRRIAHRLSLSALGADDRVKVPPEVEQLIDMSCHSTLLRLGDLSRYRNNLRTKNRSWEPALGYYSLANDLAPDNGSAHNQMAVIALADGDHLHAVYHLYRAIAVNEPHPLAQGNLEIEFKKIVAGWEKQRSQPKSDSLTTLIWWFVLLHAKYYDGEEFATRGELENEVLSRLALLLKEQTFGDVLEKFILINIAAEQFAGTKVEGKSPCVSHYVAELITY